MKAGTKPSLSNGESLLLRMRPKLASLQKDVVTFRYAVVRGVVNIIKLFGYRNAIAPINIGSGQGAPRVVVTIYQ